MSALDEFYSNVSRETFERLSKYEALLKKWNPAINLVSKSSIKDLKIRHFIDSMQIFELKPEETQTWVDIGSGGGFPGLVCAIMAKVDAPNIKFHLVESDLRKATFLRNTAREVDVQVVVHSERIEKMNSLQSDIISARALASLDKLLEFSTLHLNKSGVALFPKGASYHEEIENAKRHWDFDCKKYQSKTDPNSVILKIGNITRV
jgi:16S rRNA (guanine527-N7)-methyltransferase